MSAAVEFRVGLASCGVANGARPVHQAVERAVREAGRGTAKAVGCDGMCHREPLVEVVEDGRSVLYTHVTPEAVPAIVRRHLRPRRLSTRVRWLADSLRDDGASREAGGVAAGTGTAPRVVLENCGRLDPSSLDDALALRRLRGAALGRHGPDAGRGRRADLGLGPARPRRRRLPHRAQVGPRPAPAGAAVRHLQRRRGRPRRLHGPHRPRVRPPSRRRGPRDRRLRGRRRGGLLLRPRRVPAGRAAGPRGHPPGRGARAARRESARRPAAAAPRGARGGRRVRVRGGDGPHRLARGPAGHAAAAAALPGGAGLPRPPHRDQQRRDARLRAVDPPPRPRGLRRARHRRRARGRRSSLSPARSATAASSKCRWGSRSARSWRSIGGGVPGGRTLQGGPARRAVGRLHPREPRRHAGRLRGAPAQRRHHGLGRPRGARRPRLHGRHRPLLPPLHAATSRAASAPSAGSARGACSRSSTGCARARGARRTSRTSRSSPTACPGRASAASGRRRPTPCSRPCATSARSTRRTSATGAARRGGAPPSSDYRINASCIGCTLCAQACPVGAIAYRPHERHAVDLAACTRCNMCFEACQDGAVEVVSGGAVCAVSPRAAERTA